jgi:phage shock protein PspC (stress-responsive transcriptional regulator)
MYCPNCGKNVGELPNFCQYCGAKVSPHGYAPPPEGFPGAAQYAPPLPQRRFWRSSADKKIAGVCAGVARYFEMDPTLVRALWLLCLLAAGTGGLAYIILWILMPLDPIYPGLPV